jgi:lipopolysaccharide export system permease protein
MSIVGWMITRMMLVRFVMILAGLSIFIVTLDAVTYANDILALKNNDVNAIFIYAGLRLPTIMSGFLPFSVLLATLLSLMELSYRNELTAIWGAGQSPFSIMMLVLPIGLILGGLNFLINDQAIPRAAPTLHEWAIGDYAERRLKVGERDPIWMRSGNDILRAAASNPTSTKLEDITIFRRDEKGLLAEQIHAERAELIEGRWELTKAIIYTRAEMAPTQLERMIYSGSIKPAAQGARSGDPEEMTVKDLTWFIDNNGFGIKPTYLYETWRNKRLSLFLTSFLMMALCVPLASRFRRGGGIGMLFIVGVGLGWSYFIIEGVAQTMGELGFVSPWMAVWVPVAALTALTASLALNAETL